jgi:hypothetical protein
MLDNTRYQTISVVEGVNIDIVQSTKSNQITRREKPQSIKLSRADLHIHSTYSDGIPTIEQILEHTELHTNLDVIRARGTCNCGAPSQSTLPLELSA